MATAQPRAEEGFNSDMEKEVEGIEEAGDRL